MRFKINLKAYPGAPYFTIREHELHFNEKITTSKNLLDIEGSIRRLFGIPDTYSFGIYRRIDKAMLLDHYSIQLLDDPETGQRFRPNIASISHVPSVLDLSYSFPYVAEEYALLDALIIDTNASLGISNDIILAFTRVVLNGLKSLSVNELEAKHTKDMYLLLKVLQDLEQKGMEVIVRESNYKAAVLHQLIEINKNLNLVSPKENRSKSMIAVACEKEFFTRIDRLGYELSVEEHKDKIRFTIANYPTQSKELIEMFADRVSEL